MQWKVSIILIGFTLIFKLLIRDPYFLQLKFLIAQMNIALFSLKMLEYPAQVSMIQSLGSDV